MGGLCGSQNGQRGVRRMPRRHQREEMSRAHREIHTHTLREVKFVVLDRLSPNKVEERCDTTPGMEGV